MALAKRKQTTDTENQTPAFEEESDVTVAEREEVEVAEQVQEQPEQAATSTAVEVKPAAPLAASGPKFAPALSELEYRLSLDNVRALGIGTLPKLTADRAGIDLDGKNLGEWLRFQILSYNRRWVASAGIDGEEGTKHLRTSYDKVSLENESMTAEDYIEHLKREGYEGAEIREYVDVWGFIEESEKGGKVKEEDYTITQLQLSPTSVRSFTAHRVQAGFQAAITKKEVSNVVKVTIELREHGNNKYAAFKFSNA